MTARRAGPKPVTIVWDRSAPRLAQAASVALAVLTHVKLASVGDLQGAVDGGDDRVLGLLGSIRLPDEARALLADAELAPILGLIRAKVTNDRRRPLLTVAVCPECGQWSLVGTGVPTRCRIGRNCNGKPVKAAPGSRREVPTEAVPHPAGPDEPAGTPPTQSPRTPDGHAGCATANTGVELPPWDQPGADDGHPDPFA